MGWDDEGWKYTSIDWMQYLDGLEEDFDVSNQKSIQQQFGCSIWIDWRRLLTLPIKRIANVGRSGKLRLCWTIKIAQRQQQLRQSWD